MKSTLIQQLRCPAGTSTFHSGYLHEPSSTWVHSDISSQMLVSECLHCKATLYRDGHDWSKFPFTLRYIISEDDEI